MDSEGTLKEINIDDALYCIKSGILAARTEEDVRVKVSNCIETKILSKFQLSLRPYTAAYEVSLVSGGRADALYGHVVIEYKAPGKLASTRDVENAKSQVIGYVQGLAGSKERWGEYLGIIISDKIAFVRYLKQQDRWRCEARMK